MEISRRTSEFVTSLVTAGLGALVCYGSLENGISWDSAGPQPGYFPFYIGCLILFGSGAVIVQTLLRSTGEAPAFLDGERLKSIVGFFLPIIGFVAISVFLGLYIGMAVYTFYTMYWPGKLTLVKSLMTTVIVLAVNWIIFEILFMVPLLKGPVLNHFGIY